MYYLLVQQHYSLVNFLAKIIYYSLFPLYHGIYGWYQIEYIRRKQYWITRSRKLIIQRSRRANVHYCTERSPVKYLPCKTDRFLDNSRSVLLSVAPYLICFEAASLPSSSSRFEEVWSVLFSVLFISEQIISAYFASKFCEQIFNQLFDNLTAW